MNGNVLIVDDSLVARLSLKGIVKDTGLTIAEASSGEAALELIASGLHPDLIFLDLTMPGKGGVETLRELRSGRPTLPVVIVTADIQSRTIETVKELGATAVVRKPADKGEILSVLGRCLGEGAPA
ncbi:MAG: response regulator [Spirochaetaceae bacterium]|nr:response regulator [Spirochaetaceae bacterium]